MTRVTRGVLVCLVFLLMITPAAIAQTSGQEGTDQGTVVSATRSTILVHTDSGQYKLFEISSNTTRPKTVPVGTVVKVTSVPSSIQGNAPIATAIEVVSAAAPGAAKAAGEDSVPKSVRQMESSIKRQTSRYHIGIRAGAAIDPQQILIGGHGQFGPIFSDNFFFRPNLELMFGEVTTTVGINLEGIYRMPLNLRNHEPNLWMFYFGAGPAFNFVRQHFEEPGAPSQPFSFSDFSFDAGFNFLAGMQSRKGPFFEMKATAFSTPTVRFIFGYSF